MIQVLQADFVTTAVAPEGYPRGDVPEVAFVGRSNVGKSSMINALAQRRKLVRVSNTPGRTRTLNFFDVRLREDGTERTVRLADLPGYGFAKASKQERAGWQEMADRYLRRRPPLKVVVSIIDGEIGPTADDIVTLDYLNDAAPRILVVATKIDRLPKAKRVPSLKAIAQKLELPAGSLLGFSSTDRLGVEDVWQALLAALFDE